MLINVQPDGRPMNLEVRLGSEPRPAGIVFDDSETLEDMGASRRTLAELAADGLFSFQCEISYRLEFHFESAEDWSAFLERPNAGGLEADQELLDMALSAFSRGEGRIVAIEENLAGAYERAS